MDYDKRAYLNRIFSLPILKKAYYPIKNMLINAEDDLEIGEVQLFHKRNILKYKGNVALEMGAGQNLLQNIFLKEFLDFQYLVDISSILNISKLNRVLDKYDLEKITDLNQLKTHNIEYKAPYNLLVEDDLENKDIDFFLSSSTFEHIPVDDLIEILKKLRKILIKGSHLSLHIDYSDHLSHGDPTRDRNHFLQYSEKEWKRYNTWIVYQNRLRHDHYKNMFLEAGFEILEEEAKNFCDLPASVDSTLLTGNENDLATTGRWVLKSN